MHLHICCIMHRIVGRLFLDFLKKQIGLCSLYVVEWSQNPVTLHGFYKHSVNRKSLKIKNDTRDGTAKIEKMAADFFLPFSHLLLIETFLFFFWKIKKN